MSRWHKSSCDNPTISVEDGLPYCLSCQSSPDIDALVAAEQKAARAWSVPPDEPPHALSLYWPSTVPWEWQVPGKKRNTLYIQDNSSNRTEEADPGPEQLPVPVSPAYEKLSDYEFRVLCLLPPPEGDPDYPVHVTLEKYLFHSSPEYETTSYLWSGEDGDNSASQPIFIGTYWDVILQTDNCWNMIQYLRPRRGERLVWIDAICINQNDELEKGFQITKMGQIYKNSLRVVIYLGKDIAHTSNNRGIRRRLKLTDVQIKHRQDMLRELFSHRYFTRLWIIQEVILAPSAILPFYGDDLLLGPLSLGQMMNTISLDDSKIAPWIQHLFKGSIEGGCLEDALAMTSSATASDPRDKIFGVLGLVSHKIPNLNYQISAQHCFIGTVAHILIHERGTAILRRQFLSSTATSGKSLSWLPSWNGFRRLRRLEADYSYDHVHFLRQREALRLVQARIDASKKPLYATANYRHQKEPRIYLLPGWGAHDKTNPPKAMRESAFDGVGSKTMRTEDNLYSLPHPLQGASIDSSDGTLKIRVVTITKRGFATTNHGRKDITRDYYGSLTELTVGRFSFVVEEISYVDVPRNVLFDTHKPGHMPEESFELVLLEGKDRTDQYLLILQRYSKTQSYKLQACYKCMGIWLRAPAINKLSNDWPYLEESPSFYRQLFYRNVIDTSSKVLLPTQDVITFPISLFNLKMELLLYLKRLFDAVKPPVEPQEAQAMGVEKEDVSQDEWIVPPDFLTLEDYLKKEANLEQFPSLPSPEMTYRDCFELAQLSLYYSDVRAIAKDRVQQRDHFVAAYLEWVKKSHPEYIIATRTEGQHVLMRIPWESRWNCDYWLADRTPWYYRRGPKDDKKVQKQDFKQGGLFSSTIGGGWNKPWKKPFPGAANLSDYYYSIELMAHTDHLSRGLYESDFGNLLRLFTPATDITGETQFEILKRECREEDHAIRCPPWHLDFFDFSELDLMPKIITLT